MLRSDSSSTPPADTADLSIAEVYNRQFLLVYVANFALVTANTLMFRFAEFVAWLGGSEQSTGAIIGTGFAGVLLVRLTLGQGIDRYGTRAAWCLFSLLFIAGCGMFLGYLGVVSPASSPSLALLYVARTIYSIGLAGMFTCSVVHVQNMVPVFRRTEAIGVLGTSGFLAMIVGASLGDAIFHFYPQGEGRYAALFGSSGGLGIFYLATMVWFTRRHFHVRPQQAPPAFKLLVHYWPGTVVIVAMTLGMALALTTVFLTRFATVHHLPGIRTFFTAYSIVALIFRVPSTQWSRTIGRHKTILLGLVGNACGHAALPFVRSEWQFVVPAMACGFGHALLYPAIVSLGSGTFPRQYRGLGTTLILGLIDLGTAVSPPILGWIIDRYGFDVMFYSAAACGLAVTLYYALTAARKPDNDIDPEPEVFCEDREAAPGRP